MYEEDEQRRMIYNNRDLTKKGEGKKKERKPRERRETPRMGEELGVHILGRRVFSP